jgi:hypothetical protein
MEIAMHTQLHPSFARILATNPAVPRQSINDDDVYIVDLNKRVIVREYGPSSSTVRDARTLGVLVKLGQAAVKGLQLKGSGLVDLEG